MKKVIIAVCIALCVFAVGYNVYQEKQTNKKGTFIIKALVPLTGRSASVADSTYAGIDLAKDELAARYGDRFNIVLLDSGSDPTTALSIYRQQIEGSGDNVALFYTLSAVGKAIKPVLNGDMLALSLTAVDGLSAPEKNLFQLAPKTADIKPALVDFIKKKNIKTVSIVYPGIDYGLENLRVMKSAIAETGGQVIEEIQYSETDLDFRIQAMKLVRKNPDMIFLVGMGNSYLSVLRDMNASGYKGIFLADWSFAIPHFYTAYPDLTERMYVASNVPPAFFEEAYHAKYDKPAWLLQVGGVYDAAILIAEACSNTDCSANEMGKYMASLKDYNGAMGKYSMSPVGDIMVEAKISKIKDGRIVPIEESE